MLPANWLQEREPDLALNVFIVEMPSALAIDPQVVLETLEQSKDQESGIASCIEFLEHVLIHVPSREVAKLKKLKGQKLQRHQKAKARWSDIIVERKEKWPRVTFCTTGLHRSIFKPSPHGVLAPVREVRARLPHHCSCIP